MQISSETSIPKYKISSTSLTVSCSQPGLLYFKHLWEAVLYEWLASPGHVCLHKYKHQHVKFMAVIIKIMFL